MSNVIEGLKNELVYLEDSVDKLLVLVDFYKQQCTGIDKIKQEHMHYKNLCHRQQSVIQKSAQALKLVKQDICENA